MDVCRMRSGYYALHPEHREANDVPEGTRLPHVFGSRRRVQGGEWGARYCSWCGAKSDDGFDSSGSSAALPRWSGNIDDLPSAPERAGIRKPPAA